MKRPGLAASEDVFQLGNDRSESSSRWLTASFVALSALGTVFSFMILADANDHVPAPDAFVIPSPSDIEAVLIPCDPYLPETSVPQLPPPETSLTTTSSVRAVC